MNGPGNVVGIATGYGLDGLGIESQWGTTFSAPVQTDPGAHPAFCTMGTRSFPGVKSSRGVTLTPHPLLVPWSWKDRAIPLLPPMGRTACTEPQCLYKGALYLTSAPVHGCTLPYLSACTGVRFTLPQCLYRGALYLTSVPVHGCTLPYLSVCTGVHFTLPQCLYRGALYLTSLPVQGCALPYVSACTGVRFTFTLIQCEILCALKSKNSSII